MCKKLEQLLRTMPETDRNPAIVALARYLILDMKELDIYRMLAVSGSVLLIAITNHMSENVAPIPLLWVAPLTMYLLTFIFAFESDRMYQRWLFIPLLAVALGVAVGLVERLDLPYRGRSPYARDDMFDTVSTAEF